MSAPLTPTSINELVEAVRSAPRVLAVGAGTKPRLSAAIAAKISTAKLRGITEYDPGEFTFTALAGTPVREIARALAARGQYLPFDPMLLGFPLTRPADTLSPVGGENSPNQDFALWTPEPPPHPAFGHPLPHRGRGQGEGATGNRGVDEEGRVGGQQAAESGDVPADDGSTLGGTVAAGLSGPGRFRFGGVRDFILGVRFVDGAGRLLRMGGKVVKNAAGFDLPKFFVGSLGRFGVLAEMTFKVFPRPTSTLTLKLPVEHAKAAALLLTEAANARWEADALDYLPETNSVFLRLAGPAAALQEIAREILARWPGETLSTDESESFWTQLREFRWLHEERRTPDSDAQWSNEPLRLTEARSGPRISDPQPRQVHGEPYPLPHRGRGQGEGALHGKRILIKVPLTPTIVPAFINVVHPLNGARVHVSAGGNVAFVSLQSMADAAALDDSLQKLGLSGLTLRGDAPLWCGLRSRPQIVAAVKQALDPQNRFPALDDD